MLQQVILDRMVKIIPSEHRIYELLKYNKYWHRFDGKVTENHEKTLCGEVFKSLIVDDNTYKCSDIFEFQDVPICPSCLKIWYEKIEEEFVTDQALGKFDLSLWKENADFLRLFIENEGYDKLNQIINELLSQYLLDNNLVEKVANQINQKQN